MDMVNAMLLNSKAPENFNGKALYLLVTFLNESLTRTHLSVCYIFNWIPHKDSNMTPYEFWKKRAPRIGYLNVWGCLAKVAIPEPKKGNLGLRLLMYSFNMFYTTIPTIFWWQILKQVKYLIIPLLKPEMQYILRIFFLLKLGFLVSFPLLTLFPLIVPLLRVIIFP